MTRRLLVLGLLAAVGSVPLLACGRDEQDASPESAVGVAAVRECLRSAGALPETPPTPFEGFRTLNSLVRRANGAVRTPPPDPTHTGWLSAYFLVFDDHEGAERAAALAPKAVMEFRRRSGSSISLDTDYEPAEVQGNILVLYLRGPSDAEAQKADVEACIRDAPNR